MFPKLVSDLDHLRNEKMIAFKTESIHFDGVDFDFTIVSYMISNPELWQKPNALECRGITYDNNGKCCAAPFEKFFNVNENEQTQLNNLPTGRFIEMSKMDGSMITPVMLSTGWSKKIVFKTKKSFYSDVAVLANQCATNAVLKLSDQFISKGWTPIFEFMHPDAQIVIDYGSEPKYTLLAARCMLTGEYMPMHTLEKWADDFGVEIVKYRYSEDLGMSLKEYVDWLEHQKGIEGSVLWFADQKVGRPVANGLRVKRKTLDYLRQHRAKTELRTRDVAEMVIDETVDDIKSLVVELGYNLDPILMIENQVVNELLQIKQQVKELSDKILAEPTRKDAALKYKDDQYFGLAIKVSGGSEPDYSKFWRNNYLKQYNLKTIYSNFRGEE